MNIIIIGGGAAGFFSAITAAERNPNATVLLLEKNQRVLEKVKVSGGGRCNVTHACFEPRDLVKFYPRGSKALLGPFTRFGPSHTIEWFKQRGVALKVEADGRMFPTTDDSMTIMNCLTRAAQDAGVQVRTGMKVDSFEPQDAQWLVRCADESFVADKLMVASGSSNQVWESLRALGLKIVEAVPSLFTFNITDARIKDLSGLSVPNAHIKVLGTKLEASGPTLITHWGLSGPGILRLSAWGARDLHERDYHFELMLNLLPHMSRDEVQVELGQLKQVNAKQLVLSHSRFGLPSRLWISLVTHAGVHEQMRWGDMPKAVFNKIIENLSFGTYKVNGKSTFKEEFVTAGGVALDEVDFKRYELKRFPGLFMAGEVLDIDAITGGFNFQAAWTGGFIAGESMGEG